MKHLLPVLAFTYLPEILLISDSSLYGRSLSKCVQTEIVKLRGIQSNLNESVIKLISWGRQAAYFVFSTVVVGTLEVIICMLQRYDDSFYRLIMLAVGAAISIITIINATVFVADQHTFKRISAQGNALIAEIRETLCEFDPTQNPNNQKAVLDEMTGKLKQLRALETILYEKYFHEKTSSLISYAYAQTRVPLWASHLPKDKTSFFFMGIADNASLAEAKESASIEVITKAVNQLRQSIPATHEVLSEYVKDTAETADTAFNYNRESRTSRTYEYFTLLRLRKASAKPDSINASTAQQEIQAVLDKYKRAIEEKNVTLFQSIFRNLEPSELRRLSSSFAQAKRQTVELSVEEIQVDGDKAEARGDVRSFSFRQKGESSVRNPLLYSNLGMILRMDGLL